MTEQGLQGRQACSAPHACRSRILRLARQSRPQRSPPSPEKQRHHADKPAPSLSPTLGSTGHRPFLSAGPLLDSAGPLSPEPVTLPSVLAAESPVRAAGKEENPAASRGLTGPSQWEGQSFPGCSQAQGPALPSRHCRPLEETRPPSPTRPVAKGEGRTQSVKGVAQEEVQEGRERRCGAAGE